MTWKSTAPQGNEVGKTRWRALPYARGKVLDLGCGPNKLVDSTECIGVDSCKDNTLFNIQFKPDVKCDVEDLSLFASGTIDTVFSSHVLEHIDFIKIPSVLREWMRVIKVGGFLVLYLPDEAQYPKCEEPARGIYMSEAYCNPDHKWNINYSRVIEVMEKIGFNWDLVHFEQCSSDDEYSLFFVFKKLK
jgi:predicted SAM-dependent methyltransferase